MTAPNAVDHGPTSEYVVANIKRLRAEKRWSLAVLSERMTEAGRPLRPTGLNRLEQGNRRIDVDDLMALALALDVTPWQLLLPPEQGEPVDLTAKHSTAWAEARRWLTGVETTFTEEAPFCGQCGCLIGDMDLHAKACFG